MSTKSKRLDYIDALRVLALGSVILFHYFFSSISRGNLTSVNRSPIFGIAQYGYLGVELFFMISGFVILYSTQNRTAPDFWKRRFWRLYPMYWLGIIFVFITSNLWFWKMSGPSFKQFIFGFTMFPTAFGVNWVDPAHWFLARELQLYVFISFFLLLGLSKKLPQIFTYWAVVVMIWNLLNLDDYGFWYLNGFFSFMCGGAIIFSIREWGWTPMRVTGLAASYVAGMDTRMSKVEWLDLNRKSPHSAVVIGIVITAIYLIMLATLSNKISAWSAGWVGLAGAVTYPLFLIHDRLGRMSMQQWGNPSNQYLFYLITFGVILFISFQFLKLEKIILRFRDKN